MYAVNIYFSTKLSSYTIMLGDAHEAVSWRSRRCSNIVQNSWTVTAYYEIRIIAVRHKCAVHNRCNHQLAWSFANINQYLISVSMSLSVALAVFGFLCRPQRLFTRNNINRTCKTALAAFSAELMYSWGNVGHQFSSRCCVVCCVVCCLSDILSASNAHSTLVSKYTQYMEIKNYQATVYK